MFHITSLCRGAWRPRRLIATVVVAVIAAFTLSAGEGTALAAVPQIDGVYNLQFLHSGKCLNKPNLWTDDGVAVEQYDCVDWASTERWRLDYAGRTSSGKTKYLIRNMQSGKCLNIWLASYYDGAEVVQYSCWAGYDNETFTVSVAPEDSRYYRIRNTRSGKCLNVEGGSSDNGVRIIQYECDGYWPQHTDNMAVRFLQI
jgi:hypothetical protein